MIDKVPEGKPGRPPAEPGLDQFVRGKDNEIVSQNLRTYLFVFTTCALLIIGCEETTDQAHSDVEDEAYKSKIDSVWTEVGSFIDRMNAGKVTEDENPQRKFAPEFFSII